MRKYISVLFLATLFVACGPPPDTCTYEIDKDCFCEKYPTDTRCKQTYISLNYSEYQMFVNDIVMLTVTTNLQGDLRWYSTNPNIAKVFYGEVTAIAAGETNIVAKIGNDSAVCRVLVEAIPSIAAHQKSAKRGVGYGFSDARDISVMAPGMSWYYNWGNNISEYFDGIITQNNVIFIPMFWNGVDDAGADRVRALKLRHPELEYILGFNEPNLQGQANLTPAQAATKWLQLMDLAQELNMKLVSPGMAAGGTMDPVAWLDQFFNLVPLSSCDAIAIHCYMPNSNSAIAYTQRFKKYGKPVWMTEFCAWEGFNGGVQGQMAYMSEMLNFFESDPQVGKYAWFIPRYTSDNTAPYMQLLKQSGPELLPLGNVFVNASSQDKTSWANAGERIEAEHFSSCSVKEYVESNGTTEILNFHFQPTTDKNGNLEICDFLPKRWVEYQINVAESGEHELLVRYANYYDATFEITIDGANAFNAPFPKTGDFNIWKTAAFSVNLTAGHHTIRIKNTQGIGGFNINWLQFNKK